MAARDPVCGMRIAQARSRYSSDFEGRRYRFCSRGCRLAFDRMPGRYLLGDKEDIGEVAPGGRLRLVGHLIGVVGVAIRQLRAFRRFGRLDPGRRADHREIPERFVASLVRLGPAFVKLGQVLSTRPDLLPAEYVSALAVLHEHVAPVAFAEVAGTVREAFGRDIAEAFRSFDEQPVASASLAQVHFGILPDGAEVAVKVQRPGVREAVQRDMVVLGWLVGAARRLRPEVARRLNIAEAFEEFRRYTLHELDFSLEAETLQRFRENFRGWSDVVFPEVYWDHSGPRVLTMSRVSGLRLHEAAARLTVPERQRLTRRILEIEMKMFVSDGFFHADLHPGNVFFAPDGKIVILDVGMCGELTGRQRDHFMLYVLATGRRQVRRAFYHLTALTRRAASADEEAFYRRFEALAKAFFASTLSQVSLTQVYLGFLGAGARFGFVFPSDLLLHAKALTTAEALAFALMPDLRFDEEIRPIIAREVLRHALDGRRLRRRLQQITPELLLTGEIPPARVQDEVPEHDGSTSLLWTEVPKALLAALDNSDQPSGLVKSLISGCVRRGLSGKYTDGQVEEIVDGTWSRYLDLEPSIPRQKTLGATVMVHAAAAVISLYEVLGRSGQSEQAAAELTNSICWDVYTIMGRLPWFVSGMFTPEGGSRLRMATDAFRSFPFGSPAYVWRDVDAGEDVVAFDCVRCPVAEYFAAHNRSDLCVKTFCALDYPLARQWGAQLERSGTLAGGAPRCDFRWRHVPEPHARPDESW